MVKVGTLWAGSSTTRSPFFSVASSARGSFTFRTSLLTGALPLTTAPFMVRGGGGVGPKPKDDTSPSSTSGRIALFLMFMIFIGTYHPLLPRRAGRGLV